MVLLPPARLPHLAAAAAAGQDALSVGLTRLI